MRNGTEKGMTMTVKKCQITLPVKRKSAGQITDRIHMRMVQRRKEWEKSSDDVKELFGSTCGWRGYKYGGVTRTVEG